MVAGRHDGASLFLTKCLGQRLSLPNQLAVDLGCGRGRHLALLAQHGFHAVGADRDWDALKQARRHCRTALLLQCDILDSLPLRPGSVGLVVAVHVPLPDVMRTFPGILAVGGYAILESVPGHGENWRELPKRGALRRLIDPRFLVLDLSERAVGPVEKKAVMVRAFIQRLA